MKKDTFRDRLILILFVLLMIIPSLVFAKLSDEDLKNKNEGFYPTGLPLLNYTSDDGFGYGARVFLYNNGHRTDPYFDTAPYAMQLYVQYFATTNGKQYHELNLDTPYIFGTQFRIKTSLAYDKQLNAQYFGQGSKNADQKLTNPVTGEKYNNYLDYYNNFLNAGNKEYYKYNNYTIEKPTWYLYLYRNIGDYFKVMMGGQFEKVDVDPWDGRSFKNDMMTRTRLTDEKPLGYNGGWTNFARAGISFDTRDYEPDPKKGIYIDYAYEKAAAALGSKYDFDRHTAGARFYISPLHSLTLAFRGAYTDASGDIPFYEEPFFGFALERQWGLGGNQTLRGYKAGRFVGQTMTMGNAEFRWHIGDTVLAGQRFGLKLVGFAESGNVYDKAVDPFNAPRWNTYKTTYGGGFVIAWNMATIIHCFYGVNEEDSAMYINFNYTF